MSDYPAPPVWVTERLHAGQAIPAHPLALDDERRFDERRQRALTRYYHAAGAGGIAVGVHTTQFEIRSPEHRLLEPVLKLAAEVASECDRRTGRKTILIAGVCGATDQAVAEARLARDSGYHAGLLSLAAMNSASDIELIDHCNRVAAAIPLVGFYLQPSVGGRPLSLDFWRSFAAIPNVIAIKIAPFNRYQTLDVVRGVAESGRAGDIALYTGNDDNIVVDLLTEYTTMTASSVVRQRIVGGLLGHWACWTRSGVELLERCKELRRSDSIPAEMLGLAVEVTDANAAFFDPGHGFRGSIAGIHEVLRRQGLLANNYCLDRHEALSPGQSEEIDRVYREYPHLNDDQFVSEHLDQWLG
jgi:dihydrodipicolinate synthase/N-acetylneuraminate lyase